MRVKVIWVAAVIVLAVINVLIGQKEHLLRRGETMLFELAPRDPRSLIQGDYLELAYMIERQAAREKLESSGRLVVSLDANRVARFVRLDRGGDLAPGERRLFYRNRGGPRLGAESFFFQEGRAGRYERARYAILKVTPAGRSVLVGLCDENYQVLGGD
ncbi:MAG: GDYXXLXY domain-containing protein [Thermodesulfobacteriota bacterium]